MKNWKQLLAGFSTVALLLTNVGVTTPLAVYAEEENKTALSTESGNVTLKASESIFPGTATLKASSATPTIEGQEILAAYDLSVEYTDVVKDEETGEVLKDEDGNDKTETKTYTLEKDAKVDVTIKDSKLDALDTVNVYYLADGSYAVLQENAEVKDSAVTFTASALTTYALTNTVKPQNGGDEETLTIAKATLSDNIENDGTFVATFYSDQDGKNDITDEVLQAVQDGKLTIQWNDGSSDKDPQDDNKPNVINVADDKGAGKTYKVKVLNGVNTVVTSDGLKVAYSDKIENGDFQQPTLGADFQWKPNGTENLAWQTTAKDAQVELGRSTGNSHCVQCDVLPEQEQADGSPNQYAELNSEHAGALYQDVLTNSNASLTWNLLHHASLYQKTSATDNMYVVIMSTKDAKAALDGVNADNQQAMFRTMLSTVISNAGNGGTTTYTLQQGNKAGTTVKVTAWKVSTYGQNNYTYDDGTNSTHYGKKGDADAIDGEYTNGSGWAKYAGEYTVPDNQFLTRFFFVSGNDESPKTGNLLDNVQFKQGINAKVEYWVYNTNSQKYVLKAQESRNDVSVGDTITATKTSDYSDYTLQGTTLGKTSGGSAPKMSGKMTTSFKTSSANRVLSLYYSNAGVVSGEITWVDNDNKDKKRPESIIVELLDENGKPVTDDSGNAITTTISADNDWSYSFNGLDKDKSKKYKTRLKTVEGYIVTADPDDANNYTCTKTATVTGTLTWVDDNNVDQTRPQKVTVTVTDSNGKTYDLEVPVTKDGTLNYSFDNLPKYNADGTEITYTLTSVSTGDAKYDVSIDPKDKKDATLTRTGKTNVAGAIEWKDNDNEYGIRPETVTVQLLDENGKPVTDEKGNAITTTATLKNGSYTYSFDDLTKYDKNGNKITYTVKPIVPGYQITTTPNTDGGYDVTCTFHKDNDEYKNYFPAEDPYMWVLIDPPVEKVIKGDKPSSDATFTFELVPESNTVGMQLSDMPLPTSLKGEKNHTVVTIQGEGQEEFGNFRFDKAGTYVYHVTETDGHEKGYTYDDATYVVTFKVVYDDEDGWSCTRTIQKNGEGKDTGICTFTNTYKKPSSGKSDSNGKHDGGGYAKVDFYLVDDATTKSLNGGVYGLYTSAGELVGTYTTDANGHIQFSNLKGGTYYLVELTSPDGYALNGNKLYFTVDGTPIAVMQTNKALAGAAAGTDAGDGAGNGQGAATGDGAANGAAVGGATGDESHMMLYGATSGVAAVLLAVWFVVNRRKANG